MNASVKQPKSTNAERCGRAMAEFQADLNQLLATRQNGSVTLTVHVADGTIQKPVIQRTRFPKF